ncbi:hypothetical protein [Pedobacter sp.]
MAETNVFAQVLEMVLSTPGMTDVVRIDFKISRKNVLLLSNIIDRGLNSNGNEKDGGLLANIAKETLDELQAIGSECLEKAGLVELSNKLKSLAKS